jgi:pimeloyl-ACP methyl ester carboxylesterase
MEIPDVRYARSGNVAIAYEVLGHGPIDLVFAPFMLSAVFTRYVPLVEDFYQRLAAFSRLILFDKRGTGASDRPGMPQRWKPRWTTCARCSTTSDPSAPFSSGQDTAGKCARCSPRRIPNGPQP